MTHQSVSGNIGGRADETTFGQFRANRVDLRHESDGFSPERARCDSPFDPGSGDACAEWLCKDEQIAGTRICIGGNAPDIDYSCDSESINWFGISNRMAADDHASHLGRLRKAAAQNRGNHSWRNEIGWKADNVQCGQRAPAHGENIRERIGRGDLPVGKRVVYNGRKEINCLHKGPMPIETIYASVVESSRAHEDVAVQ